MYWQKVDYFKNLSKLEVLFFYDSVVLGMDEKKPMGPHTKPDKLRGGLQGGLTDSETQSSHIGWSETTTC